MLNGKIIVFRINECFDATTGELKMRGDMDLKG
jgi:hypothetical protein